MQTGIEFKMLNDNWMNLLDAISYTQECLGLNVVAYTPYTLRKYVNAKQEGIQTGREGELNWMWNYLVNLLRNL